MKTISLGASCLMVTIFTFVALIQVLNVNTRESSLQDTLAGAMESSLATAFNERSYNIDNDEELLADIIQGIVLELNDPRAELDIKINALNRNTGIVSLEVTGYYPSVVDGRVDRSNEATKVTVNRTVILETVRMELPGAFTVRFNHANSELYKNYTLTPGAKDNLPYPTYRASSGTFNGWVRMNGACEGVGSPTVANGCFFPNNGAGRTALSALELNENYVFQARVS